MHAGRAEQLIPAGPRSAELQGWPADLVTLRAVGAIRGLRRHRSATGPRPTELALPIGERQARTLPDLLPKFAWLEPGENSGVARTGHRHRQESGKGRINQVTSGKREPPRDGRRCADRGCIGQSGAIVVQRRRRTKLDNRGSGRTSRMSHVERSNVLRPTSCGHVFVGQESAQRMDRDRRIKDSASRQEKVPRGTFAVNSTMLHGWRGSAAVSSRFSSAF